jgi:hypothetical protein
MLQYRHVGGGGEDCLPRKFQPGNASVITEWTYALETGLVEMLLQSEHRTLDPEEAGEGASGGRGGWVAGGCWRRCWVGQGPAWLLPLVC